MSERRISLLLAGLVVMTVLVVIFDAGRRSVRTPAALPEAPPPVAPPETRSAPAQVGAPVEVIRAPREPSYLELVARAEARRQIRASAGRTYLGDMLAVRPDSTLFRWTDRAGQSIRVFVPRSSDVENFRPAFLDAVRGAFRRWADAGVPVRFNLEADSLSAEVRFRWTSHFDGDRTGQTDLRLDREGSILGGDVTLATHDPNGRPLDGPAMRVVALHEIGHLLGLDHSPDTGDLMHRDDGT